MKVRDDFVSNSSSTSFIFCFKGKTRKQLTKTIREYAEEFVCWQKLIDGEMLDGTNIAEEVDNYDNKKNHFYPIHVVNIDDVIKENNNWLKRERKHLRKETEPWIIEHSHGYILQTKLLIIKLKFLKTLGFTSVCSIAFGDSDGHFSLSNSTIGPLFDQHMRHLNLFKENLCVWTESNR